MEQQHKKRIPVSFLRCLKNPQAFGKAIYDNVNQKKSMDLAFLDALQQIKGQEELPCNVDVSQGIKYFLRSPEKVTCWVHEDGSSFCVFYSESEECYFIINLTTAVFVLSNFPDSDIASIAPLESPLKSIYVHKESSEMAAPSKPKRQKATKTQPTKEEAPITVDLQNAKNPSGVSASQIQNL